MSTTEHEHTDADHEHSDVSLRGITIFLVVLTLVCVVSFVLMWALYNYFESRAVAADPAPPALNLRAREAPPEPTLQRYPVADFKAFRAAEEVRLHRYGWVDKENKIVQIPVERAIELIAERGLPPLTPPAPAPAQPPAASPAPAPVH